MKFALVGDHWLTRPLAQAAVTAGHDLAWIGEIGNRKDPYRDLAPGAIYGGPWESLLDAKLADAVIVAPAIDEDHRVEQLRRLAQAGVPLLIAHPVCKSIHVYYEIDMIRRETRGIIHPYVPGLQHPALKKLADMVDSGDSEIGSVEQMNFERYMSDRSKENVLAQFARDVELIERVGGALQKMGALGTSDQDADYERLGVQLSGPAGMVHWSVGPVAKTPSGKMQLVGRRGRAALFMPANGEPWTLEFTDGDLPQKDTQKNLQRQIHSDWDDASMAIGRFVDAVERRTTNSDWSSATRSMELAESVVSSLRKGRTIDLLFEEASEASNFKGTMATVGCGLLLVGPVIALLFGIGDALQLHTRYWPAFMLAILVLYLLMQLLPKLVLNDQQDKKGTDR